MDIDNLAEIVGFYISQQIKNNHFIQSVKKHWEINNVKPYVGLIRKLTKIKFNKLDDKDFIKTFDNFTKTFYQFGIIPFFTMPLMQREKRYLMEF